MAVKVKPTCCNRKRKVKHCELVEGEWKCKPKVGCRSHENVKRKKPKIEAPKPQPITIADHYCGKMMYSEEEAKRVVKASNGVLRGFYYCDDCDAYHTTKQAQTPARQQWFRDHPKQFRNKHL